MNNTAQSSVELIVIMAAALLILGVLVSLVSDQVATLQKEQAVRLAESSVKKIVESVNEVYLQGAGATRQVTITWPDGVDVEQSYILDHSIVVSVAGTTIVGTTKPIVTGSLPVNAGLQSIRLKAYDGFVAIGSLSLIASPSTVFTALNRDQNSSIRVTFTNNSSQDADVTFTSDWNYSLIDLNISSESTTIPAGSTFGLDFNFHASSTAVGAFTGKLNAQATYPNSVESLVIPITAQVYTGNSGDLSVYPSALVVNTFGPDSNSVTMQLCNSGASTIKSISFTPSTGSPGDWVLGTASIPTLDPLSCTDVQISVTVPDETALGSSTGSILIKDFTGTNTYVLPVTVNVQGMNSVFVWDWSTASILQGQVSGYRMTNTGTKPVQINSMTVRNWWSCDSQKGQLTSIVVNNIQKFTGTIDDGNVADVADFNIPVLTSWIANALTFSQSVNDDNESFIVDVNFSDSTSYTTSPFGNWCGGDTNAPAKVSTLVAHSGPEPKEVTLLFTYPGDDQNTGTATGAIVKWAYSAISSESDWNAAYTIDYTMPKKTGGSAGVMGVTGFDVGYTYYFAMRFFDENNNMGSISNTPSSRAWNNFGWSMNDFNFTDMPSSSPLLSSGDVNQFRLNNVSVTTSGAQLVFRIFQDSNVNNTWIMALDMNTTHIGRIRVWYPMSSEVGIPGTAANFDSNTNASISGSVNLLNSSLIASPYRYNGTGVTMGIPNHFYVDVVTRVTDFNITTDADYVVIGGGSNQGGIGGHGGV